jgi:small GTP-binding protein
MTTKKIVVVGHFGVGKTSLIRRFVENAFSEDYKVTIGVHIMKKVVPLKKKDITLILWDTEGTDNLEDIRKSYLIGTHGFIMVCDITRPVTFKNLDQHKRYLESNFPNTPIFTVGNKSDLLPKGTIGDKKEELKFLEILVSAKEGNNVQRLFEKVAKTLS